MASKRTLAGTIGATAATALLAIVATWEGKSNDPYRDIVGIATVCFGETKVQMRRYTDAECAAMLEDSLIGYAEPVLKRNPGLRHQPYQLAAAVSLSYNIGNANYARSTVARRFSSGDLRGACDAFLMWNRAGGKFVKGLDNRRRDERRLCLTGL